MRVNTAALTTVIWFGVVTVSFANNGLMPSEQPNSLFKILMESETEKELLISEDQVDEIKDLRRKHQRQMNMRLLTAMRSAGGERSLVKKEIQKVISRLPEFEEEMLRKVLVDDQLKRLHEIRWRREIKNVGIIRVLEKTLAENVQLNAEQRSKIAKVEKEIHDERQKVLDNLEQKRIEKIMQVLSKDQKKEWDSLVGSQ